MYLLLRHLAESTAAVKIPITGSKSESNRLLILQAQYPELEVTNLSDSDDTRVLAKALSVERPEHIDIHHAGTAMRFLTAYLAGKPGVNCVLTGSDRMKQRPIALLVDALRSMGGQIDYLETEGCPPLRIKGGALEADRVQIPADTSSQYITALMLLAPALPNGLTIELLGKLTSRPYVMMTLQLLERIGIEAKMEGGQITVRGTSAIVPRSISVESDWSSASYYFSLVALSKGLSIHLSTFRQDSLQGDSALVNIYGQLGVRTVFNGESIELSKKDGFEFPDSIKLELSDTPDLAQTLAVSCLGLGIGCELTGLHTLKIKETDRLVALKTEMEKFGAMVHITADSLHLEPLAPQNLKHGVAVDTYNDHRMAMAFAPLSRKVDLRINNAEVVSKSYPGFWEDWSGCGFACDRSE